MPIRPISSFVTNSHWSVVGHVITQIYILRVPEPTSPVLATVALIDTHRIPHYFVTNSHWSGVGHVTTQTYIHRVPEPTGPVPATITLTDSPHYVVANSHQSGTGYVTTYQHTRGTRPYWSDTGYSCPVTEKTLLHYRPVRGWSHDTPHIHT